MLNEIVKRMAARGADRRTAVRHRKRYPIAWQRGSSLVPAVGIEISEKGLLFAAREVPDGEVVDVAFELGTRRVRARLALVRKGTMDRDGATWNVLAGIFQGIAADDWDAVVRYCHDAGAEEPENKAAAQLAALAGSADDAYRLLPLTVQERIVAALVGAGRLAPESDARSPLLRLRVVGRTRTGDFRLAVHSRRNIDGDVESYDSAVTVDDSGNVVLER